MNFSLNQITSLTSFIDSFEDPAFQFSVNWPAVKDSDGYWVSGHTVINPVGRAFVKALIDNGWGIVNFDWGTFVNSSEYQELMMVPNGFNQATPEQIAKVITSILRSDRFSPGWLDNSVNDGTVLRILQRLKMIESQIEDQV